MVPNPRPLVSYTSKSKSRLINSWDGQVVGSSGGMEIYLGQRFRSCAADLNYSGSYRSQYTMIAFLNLYSKSFRLYK